MANESINVNPNDILDVPSSDNADQMPTAPAQGGERLTDEEIGKFSDLVEAGKRAIKIRKLNDTEVQRLALAIHLLCEQGKIPALRSAFAHAAVFVDENCETAYTDCRYRIGIGPDAFDEEKTSLEQFSMLFLHEILHNTQNHRQRLLEKRGLNPKIVNLATDLEINGLIASGLCNVDLHGNPCDESPSNGHWDWMFGGQKKLDAKEAEAVNKRTTDMGTPARGKTYKEGDWIYNGGLVPGQGVFYDLPLDATAEQYLGFLEVDTEDLTLKQLLKEIEDSKKQNGSDENDNSDQSEQNNQNSGSLQGNDNSSQEDGSSGNQNNSSDGSNGNEQGSDAPNGEQGSGDASNGGGNGQGSSSCGGNSDGSRTYSDGSGRPIAGPDGSGGYAVHTGDGHVSRDTVSIRHNDGSKSKIESDAYVDNINVDENSELWKQVSEQLGINPITRGEEQKVRDQIAHDIEEERRTNSYGYGHADRLLNYIAKGLRPPVVDWKRVLRNTASKVTENMARGRDDYSFKRISRRRHGSEFIFPGMVSYTPTIRLAIDTSGSMSENEYKNVLSEAEGILKQTKAKLETCCVDTETSEVIRVKSVKEITRKLVGGGGTDMSAAVKQVCNEPRRNRPDVLIIATDGCYDWHSFAESLAAPELKNTAVIVIVVYKFTEDSYYARQGEMRDYQRLCKKYNRNVAVLQAYAK